MGTHFLKSIILTLSARSAAAGAAWAGGAADDCQASDVGECLAKKGCRWFSYSGYCELCDKWFGEEQQNFVGCRKWDPQEYCQGVLNIAKQKSGSDVDVESASFKDAIQHYQVTRKGGAFDDPHQLVSMCTVWCDSSTPTRNCLGQLQTRDPVRGVNYGGRFIPERFLGLPGFPDLFNGISKPNGSHQVSLCDVNTTDAGIRMESFLERNIKREHFVTMAQLGFNVVRLPLGYWNLIDLSASPDGPPDVVRRWTDLQNIMSAKQYRKWINKIFQFANDTNMLVMMDLHGVPGGQSGNQNTGCDFGYDSNFYFGTEKNIRLGLEAVDAMAKICAANSKICYGIELISEPHGPVGHTLTDPNKIMVRKLESGGLGRHVLADFYDRAIRTARRHLDRSTPIVLMDWPSWFETFWMHMAKFSYKDHGRIVFSTHLYPYTGKPTRDQESARKSFLREMKAVQDFHSHTGYEIIVSEYSLSNHGSGAETDSFDYNSFTNWFVHQCDQMGLGSMIWNFDSYWAAWGPLFKPKVGTTLVDWKNIWSSTTNPLLDLYCTSCSPPLPRNAEPLSLAPLVQKIMTSAAFVFVVMSIVIVGAIIFLYLKKPYLPNYEMVGSNVDCQTELIDIADLLAEKPLEP